MFLSINVVITPPCVSIPNVKGVTSNNKTSFTSPDNTPPCIAAPIETTSSGFIEVFACLFNSFSTRTLTAGILVDPPTNKTSSISDELNFASFIACFTGSKVLSNNVFAKTSNFDLVNFDS